jgi:hypothetical protein
MKINVILSIIVVFLSFSSFGEEQKIKFGKIDKSDLQMTIYQQDTSASAVVLYEYGQSKIEYNQSIGWRLVFEKHQRIKILKKDGVGFGDFRIRLSKNSTEKESLNGLKAITFNLENDKVVKSELSRNDVFEDDVNKYNQYVSFSMPNVKDGSVIEVKYTIDCKTFFRNMRPWKFQHSIPTVYSEYEVIIPEYFYFQKFVLGFEEFSLFDETNSQGSIQLSNTYRTGGTSRNGGVQSHTDYETIRFRNNNYHWIAENLPAFKEEGFISSSDNYIQQVQFELQTAKFPESKLYTYSQSWESINKDLTADEDFGKHVFGANRFLTDEVNDLIRDCANETEKVNKILGYIQANYKFNDYFSIYSKGLRQVLKDKNGNVADLNFLLIAMLSNAGIEAKPVILSTRANGIFLYPTVTGFNYVITQCNLNGEKVLLDAADQYSGINQIPFYCLNGRGLVIGGSQPDWVELTGFGKSDVQYFSNLEIDATGTLKGSLNVKRSGYSALGFRNKISDFNTVDKYYENFTEKQPDWEITDHQLEGLNELENPVVETIELELNNESVFAGDRIYISPVIFNPDEENPFKLKERKYPVDFGYKFNETEMTMLTIPEGYMVEEMPEAVSLSLPDQKAVFLFNITKVGENMIQTVSNVKFSQSVFFAEDYEALKEFYNRIIEKHKQQIILKKI